MGLGCFSSSSTHLNGSPRSLFSFSWQCFHVFLSFTCHVGVEITPFLVLEERKKEREKVSWVRSEPTPSLVLVCWEPTDGDVERKGSPLFFLCFYLSIDRMDGIDPKREGMDQGPGRSTTHHPTTHHTTLVLHSIPLSDKHQGHDRNKKGRKESMEWSMDPRTGARRREGWWMHMDGRNMKRCAPGFPSHRCQGHTWLPLQYASMRKRKTIPPCTWEGEERKPDDATRTKKTRIACHPHTHTIPRTKRHDVHDHVRKKETTKIKGPVHQHVKDRWKTTYREVERLHQTQTTRPLRSNVKHVATQMCTGRVPRSLGRRRRKRSTIHPMRPARSGSVRPVSIPRACACVDLDVFAPSQTRTRTRRFTCFVAS